MKRKELRAALMIGLMCFLTGAGNTNILLASCANCTNVTNLELDSNGIYDSSDALRVTVGATTNISGSLSQTGKTYFGSQTVSLSTTNTAGVSQSNVYTVFLAAGGAANNPNAVEGSVLCSTTTGSNNFITAWVCPTTLGYGPWIGVAAAAASTGSVVNVFPYGFVMALTTGTVNPGDYVYVSTQSAGYLEKAAGNASTNTIVGVALGQGNIIGGRTFIKIF